MKVVASSPVHPWQPPPTRQALFALLSPRTRTFLSSPLMTRVREIGSDVGLSIALILLAAKPLRDYMPWLHILNCVACVLSIPQNLFHALHINIRVAKAVMKKFEFWYVSENHSLLCYQKHCEILTE